MIKCNLLDGIGSRQVQTVEYNGLNPQDFAPFFNYLTWDEAMSFFCLKSAVSLKSSLAHFSNAGSRSSQCFY